jgi:hypothetical protein
MLIVKFKQPRCCDDCKVEVSPNDKINYFYKIESGRIICRDCFKEQESDASDLEVEEF